MKKTERQETERSIDEIATREEQRIAHRLADKEATTKRRKEQQRRNDQETVALAAVAQGQTPDIRGMGDNGTLRVVDPFNPERRLTAVTSLRDDPLGRLAKRRHIDEAQFMAGRRYQGDCELAEIAGACAIDTTKEAVDGGRFPDLVDDRTIAAAARLARYSRILGLEGEALMRDVLAKRMTLSQCAEARELDSRPDNPDMKYLGKRLRECLETLARALGARGPRVAEHDEGFAVLAGYANNAKLFRAVRKAMEGA